VGSRLERRAIRAAGAATFALAAAAAVQAGIPAKAPGWALNSRIVYFLELVLATVALAYALLTVAIYTLSRGIVPTAISREGLVWSDELTKATEEALADLLAQMDMFEADLEEIAQRAMLR